MITKTRSVSSVADPLRVWGCYRRLRDRRIGDPEPSRHIEDVEVEDLDGRFRTVHVYARRGAAGTRVLTDTGDDLFLPLQRIKTARGGKPGRYRFYNGYELPADYLAAKPLRVRLHGNDEDADRRLNRAEHLRAIPPTDPDYHTHSARRVDAESVNRKLSDTSTGAAHTVSATSHRMPTCPASGWAGTQQLAPPPQREGLPQRPDSPPSTKQPSKAEHDPPRPRSWRFPRLLTLAR